MAERLRLFLALWPDEAVRQAVAAASRQLYPREGAGRWVQRENLHITLRYLGPTDEAQLACVRQAMAEIPVTPFELILDQAGYWHRPRVAWLGCQQSPPELMQLVAAIESGLARCGYAPESRPYTPHLTFLRKARPLPLQVIEPIPWAVDSFALVLSETLPQGVRYSLLNRWP